MSGIFRPTARLLMQPSRRLLSSTAPTGPHTMTGKFRTMLKNVPVEVYPLAVVVGFGSSFGIYSMAKAMWGGLNRGEFRQHKRKQNETHVWEQ